MDIMNLIHDICLTKYAIINTPKWKKFKRNKLIKKYNNSILEFKNLDIFNASENMITFLLSLNKSISSHVSGYLYFDKKYMCVHVYYEEKLFGTVVEYFPVSNRFVITDNNVSYTIYRNTKISNRIASMWEPLTDKIKERYLEIIIRATDYI